MPPAAAPQPSVSERDRLIEDVADWLRSHRPENPADGHVYARRLNRTEYSHTIRDLLGLPEDPFILPEQFARFTEYFQPETGEMGETVDVAHWQGMNNPPLTRYPGITTLPADSHAEHGFANQGDQISLSPLLLEKYLAVASGLLNHALFPADHPLFAAPQGDPGSVARQRLAAFLPRAFRRPVGGREVDRYFAIFEKSRRAGNDFTKASKHMVIGALSSPHFLMRVEKTHSKREGVRSLSGHELASRLSYFLWASMPDDELLGAGLEGPVAIEAQVRRMLTDRKVKALSEHFGVPWLRLNELAAVIPDFEKFGDYYDLIGGVKRRRTVGLPMMLEALLLFETILVENRPVVEFIDADFTYLNHYLARFYQLEEECGAGLDPDAPDYQRKLARGYQDLSRAWKRCHLDDRRRGGVLTLGSTLTLTSLPLRTSPIARGAWVADVIFNRPPPPPPAEVPSLEEQDATVGKPKTLRERLAQHRDDPNCSGCHNRIDPLGFALQNYNGIGQWREVEDESGLPVDASGRLADGSAFDSVVGFKDALSGNPELFVRAFVEQLMSYALGRELTAFDDPAVSDVLDAARESGFRLQDIVVAIALSDPFGQTRTMPAEIR